MSKHTKGLWEVGYMCGISGPRTAPTVYLDCECLEDGPCTCGMGRIQQVPVSANRQAVCWLLSCDENEDLTPDAHLIAAAPDMLEALAVAVLTYHAQFEHSKLRFESPQWVVGAEAAIAKAEGK